ncbi:hypothetical protein [Burkholderia ambifaria]|uniref:hypothetical protein n=1 Tax=Burkholderia ambifaria TaxID=152480 RepID=UPI001FC7E157|nr:hypothetical protein [Burkholderia ambifaria]
MMYLVTALTRCIPNWQIALEGTGRGVNELLRDVREFLRLNALDEPMPKYCWRCRHMNGHPTLPLRSIGLRSIC